MEDRAAGDVLDFKFSTSLGGTPTTLAGTPAISVYKDNSTTESTAGITLTVDFDSRTGLNHVHITTVTDGTFYANGSDFQLVITAGTVGGLSVVGLVVGEFSLANRAVNWGKVANPTTSNALTGTSSLITSGTGTGQLDVTSGVIKANLAQILGTALTETAGQLAAAFKKFFNIATPASTMDALTLVATATNLTNAPTAGDLTATMKTSVTAAATAATPTAAAVTGAVGSVTGAVGSVTGNVGGSVASVTGAVGSLTANNDKTGYALSNAGVDAVLDRTAGVETNFTLRQALRLILSSTVAKLSGAATTTVAIRDINDTKARITATVDANGNRTALTTDVT